MTMTLKMEVFSYKSLIMCEFNCSSILYNIGSRYLKKDMFLRLFVGVINVQEKKILDVCHNN